MAFFILDDSPNFESMRKIAMDYNLTVSEVEKAYLHIHKEIRRRASEFFNFFIYLLSLHKV